MLLRLALPALAVLASTARAQEKLGEPPPSATASATRSIPMQIAVNSPLGWFTAASGAASVYAGLTSHFAARVNFARYGQEVGPAIADLFAAAGDGDGDEASYSGHTTDISTGVVFYPRALWDGPTLELSAMVRVRDTTVVDEVADPDSLATNTRTYAGRALAGWSWLIHGWAVISWAAGASVGYEKGTETSSNLLDSMPPQTRAVARETTHFEAYLRFGAAF